MRYSMLILILVLFLALSHDKAQDTGGEPPPAGYNESCEASPILYEYFGTYCLHPVYWDIPGYLPRGSAIAFVNPDTGQPDIGRVSSYYWNRELGIYVYQALYFPSPDPLLRRYVLIAPSALIALP